MEEVLEMMDMLYFHEFQPLKQYRNQENYIKELYEPFKCNNKVEAKVFYNIYINIQIKQEKYR